MRAGTPVRVAKDARGEFHGNRVSRRLGVAVDRMDRGSDRERELVFVRFDSKEGVTLFFDWVRLGDLSAA